VLMSLGLADAALRDAHSLASADPERSELLLDQGRVLFCEFGFWPSDARLPAPATGAARDALKPVRSVAEVADAAQVLASRLHRTRAGLLERVRPGLPWLPPELPQLLPEGPLELKVGKARGKARAVDQTRGLARSPEVPALLRAARNDWAALTWLCWATGLGEVALPEAPGNRPELAPAAAWNAQRLARCRERMKGEGAAAFHVEWEGMDLESMHAVLLPVAEAEWQEVQAVLAWLTQPDAPGLWAEPAKARG
jgi:hypothetical protein